MLCRDAGGVHVQSNEYVSLIFILYRFQENTQELNEHLVHSRLHGFRVNTRTILPHKITAKFTAHVLALRKKSMSVFPSKARKVGLMYGRSFKTKTTHRSSRSTLVPFFSLCAMLVRRLTGSVVSHLSTFILFRRYERNFRKSGTTALKSQDAPLWVIIYGRLLRT